MSDRIITFMIAKIELTEPWAIRAPEAGGLLDAPIARTPQGDLYIPPSSIAGSLRAHLEQHKLAEKLMGPRLSPNKKVDLTASPLRILGSDVKEAHTALRQRTAIDRERGAAAARTLRVEEIVDPGAIVTVYLRHDGSLPSGALDAFLAWQPQLGGGASIGQGQGRVCGLHYGTIDLDDNDDLLLWLTQGGKGLHKKVCCTDAKAEAARAPAKHGDLDVLQGSSDVDVFQGKCVDLQIVDALLVGVDSEEDGRSIVVPLKRGHDYIIDGSSLKGLLRNRVEYVLRSVGHEACTEVTAGGGCGTCAACEMFGAPDKPGLIRFHSAKIGGEPTCEKRTHVAIDRVTGGAAEDEGLLFSERVLTSGTVPLRITARSAPKEWVRLLVLHALRDLNDGLIGLGRGTTRGQGTLKLTDDSILDELTNNNTKCIRELLPPRDARSTCHAMPS